MRHFQRKWVCLIMEQKKLPEDFWEREADVDPLAQNPEAGAELSEIDGHQTELGGIVEQMWEDMANECVVLEGTYIPEREDIIIPPPENPEDVMRQIQENEFSTEEKSKT